MASSRRWRIEHLEAMMQNVIRPYCVTVAYAYGPAEIAAGISFDDAIGTAIAALGSHARRCVALPGKMSCEAWMETAQNDQQT
jgi:hypothetical protein